MPTPLGPCPRPQKELDNGNMSCGKHHCYGASLDTVRGVFSLQLYPEPQTSSELGGDENWFHDSLPGRVRQVREGLMAAPHKPPILRVPGRSQCTLPRLS